MWPSIILLNDDLLGPSGPLALDGRNDVFRKHLSDFFPVDVRDDLCHKCPSWTIAAISLGHILKSKWPNSNFPIEHSFAVVVIPRTSHCSHEHDLGHEPLALAGPNWIRLTGNKVVASVLFRDVKPFLIDMYKFVHGVELLVRLYEGQREINSR